MAPPYLLLALAFAALSLYFAIGLRVRFHRALAGACAATAVWACALLSEGGGGRYADAAEIGRNLAWLAFLFALARGAGARAKLSRAIDLIFLALLFPLMIQAILLAVLVYPQGAPDVGVTLLPVAAWLGMIFAIGALMVVHNLYSAMTADSRKAYGPICTGLVLLWGADLTVACLIAITGSAPPAVMVARACLGCLAAIALAFAMRGNAQSAIRLSRTATFHSLGLVAALAYGAAVGLLALYFNHTDPRGTRLLLAIVIVFALAAGPLLIPAPRLKMRFRQAVMRHMFAHRYDYRAEWLRFTETMGPPGGSDAELGPRVIKAIADIAESPSGMLLLPGETGSFHVSAVWNRALTHQNAPCASGDMLNDGKIIALDALRAHPLDPRGTAIPQWLYSDPAAWAIVPLIHFGRVMGAVLLERPLVTRSLDWEDYDLLGVAGRQLASYLAEAHAQGALVEARQFEEFNRRFAFVAHDLKNLVSQLTLLARNAEKHADNPDFRVDMVDTLNGASRRMNTLLARLMQHHHSRPKLSAPVEVRTLIDPVIAALRQQHPIVLCGPSLLVAHASAEGLETAFGHLLQNAIDASPQDEPVTVTVSPSGQDVHIEILDHGSGMSSAFIADKLFRPFVSTKANGFGIGAYEARTLIQTMGGRLDMTSRPGEGTRFTIILPSAIGAEQFDAERLSVVLPSSDAPASDAPSCDRQGPRDANRTEPAPKAVPSLRETEVEAERTSPAPSPQQPKSQAA